MWAKPGEEPDEISVTKSFFDGMERNRKYNNNILVCASRGFDLAFHVSFTATVELSVFCIELDVCSTGDVDDWRE